MKPIIIDMKDMSDSTEVYESRPNPILTGFIYLILAMVVAAFVWMYFFKIDIVVKGTGTMAASDEVATITNQVAGVITERNIEDGQKVEKGDVLYSVSCEEGALQLTTLESQLKDSEEKEEMLQAYEEWLESGKELPEKLSENLYYNEVSSRKMLVELGEESALQSYSGELSAYEAKLLANGGIKNYYTESINKSRMLIDAIKNRENVFSSEESYYWNTIENYLVQYSYTAEQYDDKIDKLQEESETLAEEITTLKTQKQSLEKSMKGNKKKSTVSSGDTTTEEQQLQSLNTQIENSEKAKETVDESITEYKEQKSSALNSYEMESIATIEKSILGYEQNLAIYNGNQIEYKNGQSTLQKQGTEVELDNLVTQEKHSVASELESCRQSQLQLQQQIEGLQQSIDNACVKASASGYVNFATELVEGDYIMAGTQVLSIIPDTENGTFTVKSYVENKDIAKVHEGMEVAYEIGAYPSREYGSLKGTVTFVSPDLKVNNSGSAYYVVETSVDAGTLHNKLGEEATLKVGMLCETKIVVEEKRVLEVLIEKIFKLV